MKAEEILKSDILDVLFDGRNKDYGAYQLRSKYSKNVALALTITFMISGVLLGIPFISSKFRHGEIENTSNTKTVSINPSLLHTKKSVQLLPIKKSQPLHKPTIKYVDLKVQVEVPDDEDIIRNKDLKPEVQISTQTQKGNPESPVYIDIASDPKGNPDGDAKKVIEEVLTKDNIYIATELMPEFPGGYSKLLAFLHENIKYPDIAKEVGISGKVILTFVVDKKGKISDIKILKDPGGGCGEEAVRVVKSMPDWKPGKQNGESVNVQFTLPITFNLK